MPQPLFPPLPEATIRERLAPPAGPVAMVLDTDTYNEIDDQFALVYALLSPNLSVEAIYAAPFHNERSSGPADGMEKSYEEILRLLERLGRPHDRFAFRGSDRWLGAGAQPVQSDAAADLVERALQPRPAPLYVVAIGAPTNVASALLLAPEIAKHIVVVWLGGHPQAWPANDEFNLRQDVAASQLLFDSGVPLVQIPCKNVAEHLRTTLPEMAYHVRGRGAIGDYLYETYAGYYADHYARSKVVWDISAIAYLNDPASIPTELRPAPVLNADLSWQPAPAGRHPFRVATDVHRDLVFADLFRKLERLARS